MSQNYRASDVLFWVEAQIWYRSGDHSIYPWWKFPMLGRSPHEITTQIHPSIITTTWYTFPVIQTSPHHKSLKDLAFQLVWPYISSYQGRKFDGFIVNNSPSYYLYAWVWNNEYIKIPPHPTLCSYCGWCCQQTCHSWSQRDQVRLL